MNISLVDQTRFLSIINACIPGCHGETICSSGDYFFIADFNNATPIIYPWSMANNTATLIMTLEAHMQQKGKRLINFESLDMYR